MNPTKVLNNITVILLLTANINILLVYLYFLEILSLKQKKAFKAKSLDIINKRRQNLRGKRTKGDRYRKAWKKEILLGNR